MSLTDSKRAEFTRGDTVYWTEYRPTYQTVAKGAVKKPPRLNGKVDVLIQSPFGFSRISPNLLFTLDQMRVVLTDQESPRGKGNLSEQSIDTILENHDS